ncbi:MAG: response regulator, partial [Magnetococcales bacterium]|nr:response regulator [Magnetococcales bacterium]
LEEEGIVVSIAVNGQEAVELVERQFFDLVLMDAQMPVMDGYEATRVIRADGRFKGMPILAMTANAMAGDREKCMMAGMNDHISKPIHPPTMFATMARHVAPRAPLLTPEATAAILATPSRPATASPSAAASAEERVILPEHLDGIDLTAGLRNVNGNRKLYRKILGGGRERFADVVPRMEQELARESYDQAGRLVHPFKGVVGTLGAGVLQH